MKRRKERKEIMKKLVLFLALILLALPAMAAVTVTCTNTADTNEAVISYTQDSAGQIRGWGLEVTVDSGATIDDCIPAYIGESNETTKGYGIFVRNIVISGGAVSDYGNPATDLGTDTVILELASLYDPDNEANEAPGTSGDHCTLVVSDDCNMTITQYALSGGVVDKDGNTPAGLASPLATCQIDAPEVCDCWGDLTADNQVAKVDVQAALNHIFGNGGTAPDFNVPSDASTICVDVTDLASSGTPDGQISKQDVQAMLNHIFGNGGTAPDYNVPCMSAPSGL
jgi:hypothetical protein